MSLLGGLKHMALSSDARLQIVEELLAERAAALARAGCVVVSRGLDPEAVRSGRGKLPAWVVYYDADPDLQGLMLLELESHQAGDGLIPEPAQATLTFESEPSPQLLIGDLEVYDPRRRSHSIGTRLLQAAQAIAEERGVSLYGHLSEVDDVERLFSFYRRLGFETQIWEKPKGPLVGEIRWTPRSSDAR